ncbi:hypothetical protein V1477_008781 [Vespula maculifrons]|uniref:Uncharacterized protein n=1 Tax=Vespula maculifrons TaxID=7453 RepID=A0ABD2CE11_VESMC
MPELVVAPVDDPRGVVAMTIILYRGAEKSWCAFHCRDSLVREGERYRGKEEEEEEEEEEEGEEEEEEKKITQTMEIARGRFSRFDDSYDLSRCFVKSSALHDRLRRRFDPHRSPTRFSLMGMTSSGTPLWTP